MEKRTARRLTLKAGEGVQRLYTMSHETEAKLDALQADTGQSRSHLVRRAIMSFHPKKKRNPQG